MTHLQTRRGKRHAFTLVELLVVIAIIAVLVSLTAAGVMKILGKANETKARAELGQLDLAIQQYLSENSVQYIPSLIILREDGQYNLNATNPNLQIEKDTIAYLQKLFGKNFNPFGQHDWNGDGVITPSTGTPGFRLEGHQCLVFFLGGIPDKNAPGTLGFSTNPQFPTLAGGTRKGPWFQNFQANRMARVPVPAGGNGFFSYLDPWSPGGTAVPYAYFSSYGPPGNGYNRYAAILKSPTNPNGHDCPTLTAPNFNLTQGPYAESAGPPARFTNPNTWQILTAGPDRMFGAGGLWSPANGIPGPPGADDMADFARGSLSSGTR
jgi:prepilin-type N-terminal cleavage/methylation domain-containing protein